MMASRRHSQTGIALLLFLLVLMGIGTTVAMSAWNGPRGRLEQERKTQEALQQAKEALIAYATSIYAAGDDRPGDLPCPDKNNDGKKETSCGGATGSNQVARLGRLPWKTLGLDDLRDASGERLWYSVSNNFKENSRHPVLNSDTTGTIQVIDGNGNTIPNVIAVVIAPGAPLQRLNATALQDRSPSGENDPANYLDETATEDNANFVDGSTTNGFINGVIRDAQGRILVNDTMLAITYNDLMPLLERKVAATVLNCLTAYAGYNDGTTNNWGRYPWAASMATSALTAPTIQYEDTDNTLFGRVPSLMFNTDATSPSMQHNWGAIPSCTISDDWFRDNWREQVFYAIADAYKPGNGTPSCGSCLTVGSTSNARVVVLVGRQKLAGQDRSNKGAIGNFLEGGNSTPYDGVFEVNAISVAFNDLLVFK